MSVPDDWRTLEKRQMVVAKIAETVQLYPDVLNRNPSEIEEAIYGKVNDKDQYMNMVGKVLLSIKHKGHQLMANRGMTNPGHVGGGGPGGMMGFQPGMHPDPSYMHAGMHMRGPHPGMPPMGHGPGMGGHHPMMSNPHHMMGGRMNMMPHGGQMMPAMGGPPHHPMMSMGGRMPHNMMYTGGGGRMPMGGGMVHRMPGMNSQPPSDGMQSVTALPNPSFSSGGPNNMMDPQMHSNPSINPNYNVASQQQQQQQQQQPMNPPAMNHQQPTAPPTNTQVPSPASKPILQAPSPRSLPMPSPSTPWNPNSPARAQSPSQMQAHPEANAAVLNKLQELQPYVPLLARMMDKIEKGHQGDKTKNEQWVKLNSLYNVIQSKNIKVPLQTLEKCHTALDSLFKKDSNASAPSPATLPPGSVSVPSPAMSVTQQGKISNPPSNKVVSPGKPPLSVSPVMSPSRNLHDFISLASPRPLSSALQPTFCPEEDPLDRLPPAKKAKLDKQAVQSFILGLKREILRLRNFYIKQIQEEGGITVDGSILLECKLISEGLPDVPSLMIKVARDYPNTSPECLIPEYQSDSCTDFHKRIGQALMNRLSSCEFRYSISHVLDTWEDSVLEMISRELEDVSE